MTSHMLLQGVKNLLAFILFRISHGKYSIHFVQEVRKQFIQTKEKNKVIEVNGNAFPWQMHAPACMEYIIQSQIMSPVPSTLKVKCKNNKINKKRPWHFLNHFVRVNQESLLMIIGSCKNGLNDWWQFPKLPQLYWLLDLWVLMM